VQVVNAWYADEDSKQPELVAAVTSAIQANNNDELETYRKKRADLEDKLAQSEAHRALLKSSYKEIQDRLALVATKKKEISRENQRLLAMNFEQSQLICNVFGVVAGGAYQGFDYSGAIARIKGMITSYLVAHDHKWTLATDQSHHNED
jgi:chromosome segregation ATPase